MIRFQSRLLYRGEVVSCPAVLRSRAEKYVYILKLGHEQPTECGIVRKYDCQIKSEASGSRGPTMGAEIYSKAPRSYHSPLSVLNHGQPHSKRLGDRDGCSYS